MDLDGTQRARKTGEKKGRKSKDGEGQWRMGLEIKSGMKNYPRRDLSRALLIPPCGI